MSIHKRDHTEKRMMSMNWKETYQQWKNHDSLNADMKQDLEQNKNNEKNLEDAFYAPLEFGTAGMRGILGAGINRMNIYTVRQATEGLARLIEEKGVNAKKQGVVIAYDPRHQSPEFAMEAAKTLGAHGIQSYVFEDLRPTPELSFAVRHLKAVAGIMVTASHNPAEYNGYKVYGEDGAQMPPADADKLTTFVRAIQNPLDINVSEEADLKEAGLLKMIGQEVDDAYLQEMKAVTQDEGLVERMGDKVSIVFSPLHGTGKMLGMRALKNAGFSNVHLVPEQAEPDPDFSTVKSPNPEDPKAFEYAIRKGKETNADILVATDPDADRLGIAAKTADGQYEVLTGNQIASLMIDYILTARKKKQAIPTNGVMVKSIVSSELPAAIADSYGVETVNVLTGFKFIAEKIKQYEKTNEHTFLFGFEESYGYLINSFVRDKDAIQALVLVSELAAYHKENNHTVFDALQNLYHDFGYYEEKTISMTMSGMDGSQKIKEIIRDLQENPPTSFAGKEVAVREDYLKRVRITQDGKETPLEEPAASALKFILTDGSWIAVRPSGTEPKIKFYLAVTDSSKAEASKKISQFEAAIHSLTE